MHEGIENGSKKFKEIMLNKKNLSPAATLSKVQLWYIHKDFNKDSVWFCVQYSDLEREVPMEYTYQKDKILPQYSWLARLIFLGQ